MADKNVHEGDEVSWKWGGGKPSGTVVEVKEQGELAIQTKKGSRVKKNATPDNPAVHIAHPKSDVVKRANELADVVHPEGEKANENEGNDKGDDAAGAAADHDAKAGKKGHDEHVADAAGGEEKEKTKEKEKKTAEPKKTGAKRGRAAAKEKDADKEQDGEEHGAAADEAAAAAEQEAAEKEEGKTTKKAKTTAGAAGKKGAKSAAGKKGAAAAAAAAAATASHAATHHKDAHDEGEASKSAPATKAAKGKAAATTATHTTTAPDAKKKREKKTARPVVNGDNIGSRTRSKTTKS